MSGNATLIGQFLTRGYPVSADFTLKLVVYFGIPMMDLVHSYKITFHPGTIDAAIMHRKIALAKHIHVLKYCDITPSTIGILCGSNASYAIIKYFMTTTTYQLDESLFLQAMFAQNVHVVRILLNIGCPISNNIITIALTGRNEKIKKLFNDWVLLDKSDTVDATITDEKISTDTLRAIKSLGL
jgi:hypothetical protein